MLTEAELAAIWKSEQPAPEREEITVPLDETKPGDFLRQTVPVRAVGPRGGRYKVRAARFDATVAGVVRPFGNMVPLTITFTNGRTVRFPCPTQPARVSREKE